MSSDSKTKLLWDIDNFSFQRNPPSMNLNRFPHAIPLNDRLKPEISPRLPIDY